jgi:hypothetical protein
MTTGTTPKGYPYPNGDDAVSNGDDVIKSLAEAVDGKAGVLAGGTVVMPSVTALTTPVSLVITLPAGRFTATPVIAVSLVISTPHVWFGATSGQASASSFTAYAAKISGSVPVANLTLAWIASQV